MPSRSTMFHRWCCMLWIMSCSKPSPYFFRPVILVQADLNFSHLKNAYRSGLAFLDVFFFWQRLIWPCLHLVVNPLYLLWWSLLLIVDVDSDTPASWRVSFSWLDVVKGFFFTIEMILWSSTTVVLCGRPGLFMLLSSPVRSFFLRMYQTVDLATPNGFVLFLKPNNHLFHLHGELLVGWCGFTATASKCKWHT